METSNANKPIYDEASTRLAYLEIISALAKNGSWSATGIERTWKQALSVPNVSIGTLWEIYNHFLESKVEDIKKFISNVDLLMTPAESLIFLVDGKTTRIYLEYELSVEAEEALKAVPGIVQSVKNRHYWQTNAEPSVIKDSLRNLVSKYSFKITEEAVDYLKKEKQEARSAALPVHTSTLIKKPNLASTFIRSEVPLGTLGFGLQGRPAISFYKSQPELSEELKRFSGLRWSGEEMAFIAPVSRLKEMAGFAAKYNLTLSPEVKKIIDSYSAPLNYDGTFNGLRGVPLTDLFVIDEGKAKRFHEFGIDTVWDLLNLIPYRYLDRSNPLLIKNLIPGVDAGLIATITAIQVDQRRRLLKLTASDSTGKLTLTYFNAVWMAKKYRIGDEVAIYGRVEEWKSDAGRSFYSMTNPIVDPLGDTTVPIIPVYPQSQKARITTQDIHSAVYESLDRLGELIDSIPVNIREEYALIPRVQALRAVHLPQILSETEEGRTRLAFDELFRMQLALLTIKKSEEAEMGLPLRAHGDLTNSFLSALPFPLTGAQTRVMAEISDDLTHESPMHRLVQGDVGSGKTMIAAIALLRGLENGYQGALMAPTEILASQLFIEMQERTSHILKKNGEPIRIEYFTNKLKGKKRTQTLKDLADGLIDIAVGTHALLVDDVVFKDLGIVVIDEQHRFGVDQRAKLRNKGRLETVSNKEIRIRPHMLIMTATPIPRSAVMSFFGDLDVSIIDELPPGRIPIYTSWIDSEIDLLESKDAPWLDIRAEVDKGHQAFIICPLVEENEKLELASALETFESLSLGALKDIKIGLVYGAQNAIERTETMRAFKNKELDVLVGTTVLEVGVSIPNATRIVILDPSRFGISQLHQLRGRVGRGSLASTCVLYGRGVSGDSRTRLQAICDSTDGFYLSEIDLNLRGFGTVFGESQSGASDLKVADLFKDKELLEKARTAAMGILEDDPRLDRRPGLRTEIKAMLGEDAAEWLVKS